MLTCTSLGTTKREIVLLVQVLEGDSGVYLKFIAKGESEPVDSPGELWITVRTWSLHAASLLTCMRGSVTPINVTSAQDLVALRSVDFSLSRGLVSSHRGSLIPFLSCHKLCLSLSL